jgi:hypothetical protein
LPAIGVPGRGQGVPSEPASWSRFLTHMYFISIPKDPALENVMVYLYIVSVLTEIPYSMLNV